MTKKTTSKRLARRTYALKQVAARSAKILKDVPPLSDGTQPMTNAQFKAWRKRHFKSRALCSAGIGLPPDILGRLENGIGRRGQPYPVPIHVSLGCAAYELGIRYYDGGEEVQVSKIK